MSQMWYKHAAVPQKQQVTQRVHTDNLSARSKVIILIFFFFQHKVKYSDLSPFVMTNI